MAIFGIYVRFLGRSFYQLLFFKRLAVIAVPMTWTSLTKDWWIESHSNLEGSMRAVISALTVTALAFALIFVLDKVADAWVIYTNYLFLAPTKRRVDCGLAIF